LQEKLDKIHEASMNILENTGIVILHENILNMIKKHGIKVSGKRAYFNENQIIDWIKKAPARFKIHARNPKYNMYIGGENTEFGPGYGAPKIINKNGKKRFAVMKDYIKFLKLFHQSELFNINGGILVQPSDLNASQSFPIMFYNSLIYSDKCLMGGPGGTESINMVMDMLEIVFGSRQCETPRIVKIANSTSPLQWDEETLDAIVTYAKNRQPLIITPGPMAGTTGPVTLAGTIAVGNAEALAGIAVTQMIREGTPVIYGFQTTTSDMRTGNIAIGSPECALCVTYGANLAKKYGLPCRGGGTNNDAKSVSVQSGYESMMVMFASSLANMNFIPHSAGILDSYGAMSYEQFIVDIEILKMIRRFMNGLDVDSEKMALDVIDQVGPAGEFLTVEHTMKYCRKEPFSPEISIRDVLSEDVNPSEKIFENINKKINSMIADYQQPEMPQDINKSLLNYLGDKGFGI
jgi:trimethylamine--corrinoid protein Co-methyltransferase